MNRRDSNTRDYSPNPRPTRTERLRRRRRKQVTILAILAVLIIILIVSVVLIVREITGGSSTDNQPSVTTPGADVLDEHPEAYAFDGDNSTYMLSSFNQAEGAYFAVDLGNTVELTSVSVLSAHSDYYIRGGVIQVSVNGTDWSTVGEEFAGITTSDGASSSFAFSTPVSAKYLRVYLTDAANAPMAINEIAVSASGTSNVMMNFMGMGIAGEWNENTTVPSTGGDVTVAPPVSGNDNTTATPPVGGYTSLLKPSTDIAKGSLILVNNRYEYVFPATESNIERLYDARESAPAPDGTMKTIYQLAGSEKILLDSTALYNFKNMCKALVAETGLNNIHVGFNGGYRSYETQKGLYEKYPITAAAPGQSDHNTGLGIDITLYIDGAVYQLDGSKDICRTISNWLAMNAHKYGFVRRFDPAKETHTGMPAGRDDWHYRYVGEAHAYYMAQNNLCLEEYLALLESYYPYSGSHLIFTADNGKKYEIYFVAKSDTDVTTIQVPAGKPYTVSGNNYSGFIVTVES